MKNHQKSKAFALVALAGAMFGASASAYDAGDAKVRIESSKAQIGRRMQQCNELGVRQLDTAHKQRDMDAASPATVGPSTPASVGKITSSDHFFCTTLNGLAQSTLTSWKIES